MWRVVTEDTKLRDVDLKAGSLPGFLTHSVGFRGKGVWGVWGVWGVRLLPYPPTLPTPLGFLTSEKSR
ncbi:hypothetical protein CK516_23515, partial [Nostoc sp. 'Peltigera malacea cyanobiont' DB3992]